MSVRAGISERCSCGRQNLRSVIWRRRIYAGVGLTVCSIYAQIGSPLAAEATITASGAQSTTGQGISLSLSGYIGIVVASLFIGGLWALVDRWLNTAKVPLPQAYLRRLWLRRALRDYPLYDPPHKVEERLLSKAKAKENFD